MCVCVFERERERHYLPVVPLRQFKLIHRIVGVAPHRQRRHVFVVHFERLAGVSEHVFAIPQLLVALGPHQQELHAICFYLFFLLLYIYCSIWHSATLSKSSTQSVCTCMYVCTHMCVSNKYGYTHMNISLYIHTYIRMYRYVYVYSSLWHSARFSKSLVYVCVYWIYHGGERGTTQPRT